MINLFPEKPAPHLTGDCYVADYTEYTGNLKGVEISETPFDDIPSFHLKKKGRGNITYQAINLEKFPSFIKGIDNCECIFNALSDCNKPWLMFLETKYVSKAENVKNYPFSACVQMKETLDKLISLGKVDPDKRRIYFVYSAPAYTEKAPFSSFELTQSRLLRELEMNGIIYMGYNTMLILTPQYLMKPQQRV